MTDNDTRYEPHGYEVTYDEQANPQSVLVHCFDPDERNADGVSFEINDGVAEFDGMTHSHSYSSDQEFDLLRAGLEYVTKLDVVDRLPQGELLEEVQ